MMLVRTLLFLPALLLSLPGGLPLAAAQAPPAPDLTSAPVPDPLPEDAVPVPDPPPAEVAPAADFAETAGLEAPADELPGPRFLTLTFSPLLLLGDPRMAELCAELHLIGGSALALVAGVGQGTVQTTLGDESMTLWELGGQLQYYGLGSFEHGVKFGVELLYAAAATEPSGEAVAGSAEGFFLGPFLGYKFVSDLGLTFDGQLGFRSVFFTPQNDAQRTADIRGELDDLVVLLRLNVGWSF